ncbi:MAG: GNAT family N-acetyltransferase [Gammaproteobacteria bacterium]|nr:GNAT family N-acetyltransferase [Gammaproteobacteria bacterium]MDP2139850.1 GNAT family N-acetyltransferase [Gammaproteobacteria bacterium]MDP2347099.1 GNAT family N-acetyltransferase [Gammaproteobacteria bacterium]
MSLLLQAPQPLAATHKVDEFECGEPTLDEWLKRRAMINQLSGGSRTFVVGDQNSSVYGYYSMAAGAVSHQMATGQVRRNMPDPVPVMVLARLAVDLRAQGIKLGASLLQDAVNRAVVVSRNAGVRALLVHALHDRAREFYEHYGFQPSPSHPMTLMLRLTTRHFEHDQEK